MKSQFHKECVEMLQHSVVTDIGELSDKIETLHLRHLKMLAPRQETIQEFLTPKTKIK